jgi:DNA-binding NarL/FixJ family response regulator
MRVRVLLVDDSPVMRQAVGALLQGEPDLEIAGEAADGSQAIALTRQLQPAVVLMDVTMPGLDGIQATRTIHAEFPQIPVIGLSMLAGREHAQAMREAGAVTYLTKSGPPEALLAAIRASAGRPPG